MDEMSASGAVKVFFPGVRPSRQGPCANGNPFLGPPFGTTRAAVTQLGECETEDLEVAGSSPACGTAPSKTVIPGALFSSRPALAQPGQSG